MSSNSSPGIPDGAPAGPVVIYFSVVVVVPRVGEMVLKDERSVRENHLRYNTPSYNFELIIGKLNHQNYIHARRKIVNVILLNFRSNLGHKNKLEVI